MYWDFLLRLLQREWGDGKRGKEKGDRELERGEGVNGRETMERERERERKR